MIAAVFALLLLSRAVQAVTLSELSVQVNRATQGGLSEAEEQNLIGQLGDVSVEVANRYDQWVRTGSESMRGSAVSLARELLPLLERLHGYHQTRVDKAHNDIVAADGNPEVLYEQRPWLVDRGFALATWGQLCWLYYRLAALLPEEKEANARRLRKAVEGFSEFVYGEDQKLRDESLLGRALAERELGEYAAAVGDLQALIEQGKTSPLYWPARLTLAEVRIAAGDPSPALSETQKLVAEAASASLPQDFVNQARLLRFHALALASKKGAGEGVRREAAALSRQLAQLGPVWSKRVNEIALTSMDDARDLLGSTASAEWIAAENLASEERFQQAIPAYETVLRGAAPNSDHATLVHHRLGVCYFRVGRYEDAEREFRAFLNQAKASPLAAEAAYLRFRAAEGIFRAKPSTETQELFVSAAEAYVTEHPRHESAHEAHFRLGEIRQGRQQFLEAADAYAKVNGAPAFVIRAAAGEVQCMADLLLNAPDDATKAWADPLRARAAKAFQRFEQILNREAKGPALQDLRGRTTLAKAMAEGAGPGAQLDQSLVTLRDFETRYPSLTDLHPLATALRLSAQTALRRLDEAEKSFTVLVGSADPRAIELLEKISRSFLRNSADEAGERQAESQRWAVLAATAYERLREAGRPIPTEVKVNLARTYSEQRRFDDAALLYAELVREMPQSKSVLRNAALVADQRKAHAEAAEYWGRLGKLQEVGTPAWYETRLRTAENLIAAGQVPQGCTSLREADEFRPDLRDATTRKRFSDVAARACREG